MSEQPTLFPTEPRSGRTRRPREVIEAEKRDRQIRRQHWELKRTEREAKRIARTKKREIRERLDAKTPIVERTPESFSPHYGCLACGLGMMEVPVRVFDVEGKPAVGFACLECAQYFEAVGA